MASSMQNTRVSSPLYCSCCRVCNMWCWRLFKWLPVLLIVAIISWSYFAYVILLCIFTITNVVQKSVYLVVYHVLLIMFAWSYWRTIFADIQPIPDKFKLPQAELEKLLSAETEDGQRTILEAFAKDLPIVTRLNVIYKGIKKCLCNHETKSEILERFADQNNILTRTMSGSVRYCNRCVLVKPDRAHHCSICSRCVMKMDHHCPWVNNCVCFHNYKFFMLFLGYALIYCLFIAATCLPYFIRFWKISQQFKLGNCERLVANGTITDMCLELINGEFGPMASTGRYHIVFAFFVSLMFAISLGSLFGYHCYLVLHNRTTLDMLVGYNKLGSHANQLLNTMFKILVNEAFRAPMFRGGSDKNGFSLGAYNNFKEVFGVSPNLWLLPVFSSRGDGCEYPVRREHQLQTFSAPQDAHGYESMGTTRSSFGDGIVYPVPRQDEESESLISSERWERWGERARPFDERGSSSFDEL